MLVPNKNNNYNDNHNNNNYRSPYRLDLNVREGHEGYHTLRQCPAPLGMKSLRQHEATICSQIAGGVAPVKTVAQQTALTAKKQKMAMTVAMKPGQQIAMQAFMLWMSGSQLNMFSINVTTSAILSPLSAIFSMDAAFRAFGGDVDLQMPKLIFVGLNLVFLGIGLYKMSSMRLLPTTSADWTSKIVWKDMVEITSIPPDAMMPWLD